MKTVSRLFVLAALGAALTGAFAQSTTTPATTPSTNSPAATNLPGDFDQKHPRIAEVNKRLRAERARIEADLHAGKITAKQANRLLADARRIHRQEVNDAEKNGDHLTKAEQEQLNKEEAVLTDKVKVDADKDQLDKDKKAEEAAKSADKSESASHKSGK